MKGISHLNNTRPDRPRCDLAVDHAGEHRARQRDGNQPGAEDRGDEHEVEYPHDGTPITTRTAKRTWVGASRSSEQHNWRWITATRLQQRPTLESGALETRMLLPFLLMLGDIYFHL